MPADFEEILLVTESYFQNIRSESISFKTFGQKRIQNGFTGIWIVSMLDFSVWNKMTRCFKGMSCSCLNLACF